MRISAELLSQAEQRTNPLNDRELVLREYGIPAIENLGAAVAAAASGATAASGSDSELFDSIDLSNNRITRLENFPRMRRLKHMYVGNNLIESVDAKNLGKNVPNLISLTLSNNNVSSLAEVSNVATACPKLEFLSLSGNPVTRRQHYRLYVIHRLPNLKVLDYHKVKPAERRRAERLATSAAGAALESDVQVEAMASAAATKTFEPGEGLTTAVDGEESGGRAVVTNFSTEEKEQIRQLLSNASSAKELEEIENCVRRGVLPPALLSATKKRPAPPSTDHNNDEGTTNGEEPSKANGNDDGETKPPAAKRRQVA